MSRPPAESSTDAADATTVLHDVQSALADSRERLREREARLAAALAAANQQAWTFFAEDRVFLVSAPASDMNGLTSERRASQEELWAQVDPGDRRRLDDALAQCLAGQADFDVSYRVVYADTGQTRWLRSVGRLVRSGSGSTNARLAIHGVTMDLTEQRRAQAALVDSEARFRLIADAMPQIVWATRPDGYHDYFNERWFDYTGMPRPDEPGGEYDPAGSGQGWNWKDYLHPDDYATTLSAWSASLATGEPYRVEYRFKRHDGQYRWFDGRALALRDAAGRITRWFGTLTDIHDQKLALQERQQLFERLQASEAQLRAIFETVPVGLVFARAPEGEIVGRNRRADEMFGHPVLRSPDIDAYGEWVSFHPDGRQVAAHEYPLAQVLRGAARAELEVLHQRGDGHRTWMRFIAAPIRDPATDATTGGVAAALDIDAERRAIEALREADRRKDEFLAMLAHELRNPLAPVLNSAKLLARREVLSETGQRALEMIERQTTHMKRLVDDLLEVSRITRGIIELRPEPMLLMSAVAEVVEAVLPAIERRGQTLDVIQPPRPVKVHADPVRVAQMVENLLTNASKYTPMGGAIRIEVQATDDEAVVRVSDNGIGIPPDKLDSVFELFVQAEPGVGEHTGGLGIGLAMVRRLAELHGGRVHAESGGRGQGSIFVLRLPTKPR